MRIWVKKWKENHMTGDTVVEDYTDDTRTHKVFAALKSACRTFDLAEPIWLDSNIKEFKAHSKVRFYSDSFIEEIPFDYLEMMIIEED